MALPFSEWTREEKDEFAQKKMEEMRLRNELFKQRHAEVEQDRLKAEAKDSAVTKIACKDKKSSEDFIEDASRQREWDKGKPNINDVKWSPDMTQSYHESNWKSFPGEKVDKRENLNRMGLRNYNQKGQQVPSRFRGFGRQRNFSSSSQENTFRGNKKYSDQTNITYPSSNCDYHKSDKSSKNSSFGSDAEIWESEHIKHPKKENRVWCNEGSTEVYHKQSRIEKWVKSVDSDCSWNEEVQNKKDSCESTHRNQELKQTKLDLFDTKKKGNVPQEVTYPRIKEYQNKKCTDTKLNLEFKNSCQQECNENYAYVSKEFKCVNSGDTNSNKEKLSKSLGLWEDVENESEIQFDFPDFNEDFSNELQYVRSTDCQNSSMKILTKDGNLSESAHTSSIMKENHSTPRSLSPCRASDEKYERAIKSSCQKSNFENKSYNNQRLGFKPSSTGQFPNSSSSCNTATSSQKLYSTQYEKQNKSSNSLQTLKKTQVYKGNWDTINVVFDEKSFDKGRELQLDQKGVKKNLDGYDCWADAEDNNIKWNLDDKALIWKQGSKCSLKKETTFSSSHKENDFSSDGWADTNSDVNWNLNAGD